MRSLLKTIISLGMVLFLLGAVKNGYDLDKADKLFDAGTFQEALKEYEGVEKTAETWDLKTKAVLRQVECLGHLFRYEEAAQKLKDAKEPTTVPNKIRHLLFKAEFLRNSLQQYRNIMPEEIIEGSEGKEVAKMTKKEVLAQIKAAYVSLYALKKEMQAMPLKDEGYFIDTKDVDLEEYASLYEFYVISFADFALDNVTSQVAWPEASDVLKEEFASKVDENASSSLLAAMLYNEASASSASLRVKEAFYLRRILLPVDRPNFFDLKDLAEPKTEADYRDNEALLIKVQEILLACGEKFVSPIEKAKALYRAALIYRTQNNFVKAVELFKKVSEKYSNTYYAYLSVQALAEIERPQLNVNGGQVLPPAKNALTVNTKNIKEVYFRAYSIDYAAFTKKIREIYSRQNNNYYSYYYTRHGSLVDQEVVKKYVLTLSPVKEWKTAVKTENYYEYSYTTVEDQSFEMGVYVVLSSASSSFSVGSDLVAGTLLNVTDMMLVSTSGYGEKTLEAFKNNLEGDGAGEIKDDAMRFYTLNGFTGELLPGAALNIEYTGHTSDQWYNEHALSNSEKPVSFDTKFDPKPQTYKSYSFYVHGKKGRSNAFLETSFNWNGQNPVSMYVETDRPIYRPGDTVKYKVMGIRQRKSGYSPITEGTEIYVSARDTNWKEFATANLKAGSFGSAEGSFVIPSGKLLGSYQINVSCTDKNYNGNASAQIHVEEYKRPEYEVKLKAPEKPLKYGETAEVKGEAKYYFGGAVTGAKVKYKIKRQKYIPWRCWWASYYNYGSEEIGAGETVADDKGVFTVSFKAEPTPNASASEYVADMTRYTIEAGARDQGGREINATVECFAGKSGFYGVAEQKKNFFFEREDVLLTAKTLTVNETPYDSKVSYEVFTLKQNKIENVSFVDNTSIDQRFTQNDDKNDRLVKTGEFVTGKEGKSDINLGRLAQGPYRVVFTVDSDSDKETKVKWTKNIIVARDIWTAIPLQVSSICMAEKEEYKPGETASLLIGASPLDGNYMCEIYAGEYFVKSFRPEGKFPVRIVEIPVTEKYKGGFSVRWFGVKDLKLGGGSENCNVPWSEKKLKVELTPFLDTLIPGKDHTYGVKILDSEGKPVKAEVLALMYDRSLEYYAKSSNAWLSNLWEQRFGYQNAQGSFINYASRTYGITEGIWDKMLRLFTRDVKVPKEPTIRTSERTWAKGNRYLRKMKSSYNGLSDEGSLAAGGKYIEVEESVKSDRPAEAPAMYKKLVDAEKKEMRAGSDKDQLQSMSEMKQMNEQVAGAVDNIQARKAFADTAFFVPHILTGIDGKGEFTFKAPEQVTSWTVKVLAYTGEIQEGVITKEAATKKDLMVRLDLPRFFREKDKGMVQAIVHNESDKEVTGVLKFDIVDNEKNINEKLGALENVKKFTIKPHSLVSFDWMLAVPAGVADYKFRAAAVAGDLSDAEEREIPILPSRERLIETTLIALSGTETGTLEIKLKDDSTRINEFMQVQVEPQLMLSVMNALPFLVDYPYECVEQTLNKFVPLAITNAIYEKYPEIKAAVGKLPKRDGTTAPWEKDDPKRLVKLMETPWLWESEGRKYCWGAIDMFDPANVAKLKEEKLEKLVKFQLSSGGFPWFDGGKEDFYMTLLVLDGFAEARKYGVELPKDTVNRALAYVNRRIPEYLKAEEYGLSMAVYAAYVVTSFSPEEFYEARRSHEGAAAWAVFIDKNVFKLSPFGKGYLASIYFRLKNDKRANEVLDMALDGSREDKIAGVYWAPERYSWIWYNDSVEKHAFFLKLVSDYRPKDKRIKGMVQWLLFNKKGNNWKSTKSSAAAIYSILNYMKNTGSLASGETFTVKWNKTSETVQVKPDEFLEKPIRLEKKGMDIVEGDNKAEVKKEGKGFAFASMTWIYSTDKVPEASAEGMLNLSKTYYLRVKEGDTYHLKPLNSGDKVKVADEIEVYLKINTRSQFEYMHLKDPKPAGFEAVNLLSGWKWEKLSFYEEQRDSLTNFFISWLPHGEYVLRYKLKPTKAGTFRVGAATLQSMYSPDMAGHSSGFIIQVE